MQLTGPVRMTGKVEEDGIKGELDGNGTWTIEWRAVVR